MRPTVLLTIADALGRLAGAIPPTKPFGYLDPGSGSYLLQLLLAALLGALFVMRHSWRRITAFFGKLFHRGEEEKPDEQ